MGFQLVVLPARPHTVELQITVFTGTAVCYTGRTISRRSFTGAAIHSRIPNHCFTGTAADFRMTHRTVADTVAHFRIWNRTFAGAATLFKISSHIPNGFLTGLSFNGYLIDISAEICKNLWKKR